jgi:hypothetical protein
MQKAQYRTDNQETMAQQVAQYVHDILRDYDDVAAKMQ